MGPLLHLLAYLALLYVAARLAGRLFRKASSERERPPEPVEKPPPLARSEIEDAEWEEVEDEERRRR
ncbi:MAG: hypothetical protein EHM19_09600 [Candidatus Latescibacterota bacterium]|nr:MAG: hypothetical protein EHM19_09600 [Candidatus Latescibacterota bacterium]